MSAADQARADAANDSYNNRSRGDIEPQKSVYLDGQKYQVIGYAASVATGFHATAYESVAQPHEIIIAYRGTDPGLFSGATTADKKAHALTTLQDIAVDATMVRDTVNLQKSDADAFTAEILAKAATLGIPRDRIFLAGHSLGGTLGEIEAAEWGLTGTTFNAYGAAGLIDGPPKPGCHLTNYVMAGDVVSAANRHIGETVRLASAEDLQSLREGRYLDAPAGAPPPNALLAMRLSDHGGGHFSGPDSVLAPAKLAQYEQNYLQHKSAIDRYRSDVHRERGELAIALREIDGKESPRPGRLPPDIQRQVDEYIAVRVDPSLRHAIEHNALVRDTERTLQQSADIARAGYGYVQAQDERVASVAWEAGRAAAPFAPGAGLLGLAVGEAANLHGQAVAATGRFVDGQLQSAKEAVGQGARDVANAAVAKIHDPDFQGKALGVADGAIDAYGDAQAKVLAAAGLYQGGTQAVVRGEKSLEQATVQGLEMAGQLAERGVQATGQALRQGVEATAQAANFAYGKLAGPEPWALRDAPSAETPASLPSSARMTVPVERGHLPGDPRHPENPDRALFDELHRRIPEASENRLLQLTAACHAKGITGENLELVHLNEQSHSVVMASGGLRPQVVAVDVGKPSPQPEQSIQQIQAFDAGQLQLNQQVQQQMQLMTMQAQQGPSMGMPR